MARFLALIFVLAAGRGAHAEDACRGRCLLVDTSPGSLDILSRWPRPDLKMLLVGDYGMVEGTTVPEMTTECEARTRLEATPTSQALLVAYATYYTYAGQSAVIDFVPLKSCDSEL